MATVVKVILVLSFPLNQNEYIILSDYITLYVYSLCIQLSETVLLLNGFFRRINLVLVVFELLQRLFCRNMLMNEQNGEHLLLYLTFGEPEVIKI